MVKKKQTSKERYGLEGHYIHVRAVLLVPAKTASVAMEWIDTILNKSFSPVKTSYCVVDEPDDVDTDSPMAAPMRRSELEPKSIRARSSSMAPHSRRRR